MAPISIKTVLISESVDARCRKILEENGIRVTEKQNMTKDALIAEIRVGVAHSLSHSCSRMQPLSSFFTLRNMHHCVKLSRFSRRRIAAFCDASLQLHREGFDPLTPVVVCFFFLMQSSVKLCMLFNFGLCPHVTFSLPCRIVLGVTIDF